MSIRVSPQHTGAGDPALADACAGKPPDRCARLLAAAGAIVGRRDDPLADVEETLAARIRAAQVGAVVQLTPLTMAVTLLNAGVVLLAFWDNGPRWPLAAWFGLVALLATAALRSWHRGQRRGPLTTVSPSALGRTTTHAVLLAGAWGVAPAVLFPTADPFGRFVLGCLAAGMITGSAFALSAVPRAGLAYAWTLSLLMAGGMAAAGEPPLLAAAVMLCLYAAFISHNITAHGTLLVETLRGRREIEEQREVLGLLLRDFEESASDCLWETDAAGRLRRAPPRLVQALALTSDLVAGAYLPELLRCERQAETPESDLAAHLAAGRAFRELLMPVQAGGEERIWSLTARPVHDHAGAFRGFRGVAADVTDRVQAEARAVHLAYHDPLTELANRRRLLEELAATLTRLRREGGNAALLLVDLDGFKGVNDTLGHPAGDELLRAVAARLRECTRETDLVARLGGDEFAIIQASVEQPTEVALLADRLVQALREPFEIGGQRVEIGTSVGVMLADATATADEALRNADAALYRAKADGRGTWRFFEAGMDAEMQARRTLEADLRRALIEGQFEVFYQPLIDAGTEGLTGFEALLRWNHPTRGMVSPSEFIPLAEETGLIRAIGAWVLERACTDAAGWPAHVRVAVNLSPVQFARGNLVREVEQALVASGLAPGRLELEITENVLLQDNDATLGILLRLRGMGVRIAMDDFGTGYSSLSYLRRFPFDKIKIDQSFIRNVGTEKGSVEIIRAVVGLGQALSMKVLAEGVETTEQLRMLQAEGCDELQGYLFSKPKPLQDVQDIIDAHWAAQDGSTRGPTLVIDNTSNTKVLA